MLSSKQFAREKQEEYGLLPHTPLPVPLLEQRGHIASIAPASAGEETDHKMLGKLIKSKGPGLVFQISGNAAGSVPNYFNISCSHAHLEV